MKTDEKKIDPKKVVETKREPQVEVALEAETADPCPALDDLAVRAPWCTGE